MGSIAYKDVSIIFQQLYEESPDKGEQGKKETGLKRIQNFTKLKKKVQFNCVQKYSTPFRMNTGIFWLPSVYYRQNNTRRICLYKVHIYHMYFERQRAQIETYIICL